MSQIKNEDSSMCITIIIFASSTTEFIMYFKVIYIMRFGLVKIVSVHDGLFVILLDKLRMNVAN